MAVLDSCAVDNARTPCHHCCSGQMRFSLNRSVGSICFCLEQGGRVGRTVARRLKVPASYMVWLDGLALLLVENGDGDDADGDETGSLVDVAVGEDRDRRTTSQLARSNGCQYNTRVFTPTSG